MISLLRGSFAWLPVSFLSCLLWSPGSASARERTDLSLSASAQVFYGDLPTREEAFNVNPYGPGIGVRAAVTLPNSIYLALSFEHFFGGAPTAWSNVVSVSEETTLDQVTAWGGYQLDFDGVTLRPCLGLGYAHAIEKATIRGLGEVVHRRESDGYVIVSPGLAFVTPVGPASFVIEGRYSFLPETLAVGDALLIGVGFGMDF